jgi:hypothetical protein
LSCVAWVIGISRVYDEDALSLLSKKRRAMLKREVRRAGQSAVAQSLYKIFGNLGPRDSKSKEAQNNVENDPEEQTITII